MPTVEERLWDTWVEAASKRADQELTTMRWTQYGDHGPGHELLGDAQRVLELGFGTGRHLMFLLERGFDVRGVDLSPLGVALALERYPEVGKSRFACADVRDYLDSTSESFEAMYSVFGACWFTDPHDLLTLVRKRLSPGGRLVFSQPPAIPGCYGPQGMFKGGFAGEPMFLRRYDYTPEAWGELLRAAGFHDVEVLILDAPVAGNIGTLLVRSS